MKLTKISCAVALALGSPQPTMMPAPLAPMRDYPLFQFWKAIESRRGGQA